MIKATWALTQDAFGRWHLGYTTRGLYSTSDKVEVVRNTKLVPDVPDFPTFTAKQRDQYWRVKDFMEKLLLHTFFP